MNFLGLSIDIHLKMKASSEANEANHPPPNSTGVSSIEDLLNAIRDLIEQEKGMEVNRAQDLNNALNRFSSTFNAQATIDPETLKHIAGTGMLNAKHSGEIAVELAQQGELFSFFTAITTVFLPLAFMAQVSLNFWPYFLVHAI